MRLAKVEAVIRPMQPGDLDRVLSLQARCYPPELHDSRPAFESRLHIADDLCLVAELADELAGYIVSHPWRSLSPPPVDQVVTAGQASSSAPSIWYVHDLSVSPDVGGGGLGRRLFEAARKNAVRNGFTRSELIAVRGAASYWVRLGYAPVMCDSVLQEKVAGYGGDAVYMARDIV